jgi:hypothetical protein
MPQHIAEPTPADPRRPAVKLLVAASLVLLADVVAFALPARADDSVPNYTRDIQPIFNNRCVACHGCLGSPCNQVAIEGELVPA